MPRSSGVLFKLVGREGMAVIELAVLDPEGSFFLCTRTCSVGSMNVS